MSVAVDPFASLRSWDLSVELGGREYTLVPALAQQWLPILMTDPIDVAAIIPAMIAGADDQDELETALIAGEVDLGEVEQVAREVVTAAAGRDWWWACNLLATVAGAWMVIYGSLVRSGLDVARLPLGAVLDAMYMECASRMDKAHLDDFNRQLNIPPAGVTPEIDEDREAMSFLAMMNAGV